MFWQQIQVLSKQGTVSNILKNYWEGKNQICNFGTFDAHILTCEIDQLKKDVCNISSIKLF